METHSLVLISGDGGERRFGENEGAEVEEFALLLDAILREINDVESRLIAVHRVENNLEEKFK